MTQIKMSDFEEATGLLEQDSIIVLQNGENKRITNANLMEPIREAISSQGTRLDTSKQDKLISGTNIKTINNKSLLGSGNINISGGGGGGSTDIEIELPAYTEYHTVGDTTYGLIVNGSRTYEDTSFEQAPSINLASGQSEDGKYIQIYIDSGQYSVSFTNALEDVSDSDIPSEFIFVGDDIDALDFSNFGAISHDVYSPFYNNTKSSIGYLNVSNSDHNVILKTTFFFDYSFNTYYYDSEGERVERNNITIRINTDTFTNSMDDSSLTKNIKTVNYCIPIDTLYIEGIRPASEPSE